MTMKRRDALKTIGALGATAGIAKLVPGCGSGGGNDPDATPPPGPTTVVLMMENRSYDHYLGARSMLEGKPGDGLTAKMMNLTMAGQAIAPYAATFETQCVLDPPHGWDIWDVQSDGGTNGGFVRAYEQRTGATREVMQYQMRENIPATWAIADNYASCDRWFCSVRGPTWPNRMYWHTGTSSGIMSNMLPDGGFVWPSLYHRLDAKGVDWCYYFTDLPVVSVVSDLDLDGRVKRIEDFFQDAERGRLPPVVYIDPGFSGNDDHPPHHTFLGQGLIASIYLALANGPQWNQSLFLVTYDESGGFFDHVPPPLTSDEHAAAGFDQLGFRVPTIAAGPYVKQGHVSSVVYDHTSMLKHFEVKYGLDPLTMRSTAANDILDLFDLDRLAANQPNAPAAIPEIVLDYEAIDAACNAEEAKKHHPVLQWADKNAAKLRARGFDRRAEFEGTVQNIFEFLDRHNGGRVRGGRKILI
jgi:phospholipase C